MIMFSSLSSHTTDWSAFDPDQDRDLIALMNEARTPDDLVAASRSARARFRRRAAESPVARERRGFRRALSMQLVPGARR